jgi:tetratricopeptide (TPR) repeat protein
MQYIEGRTLAQLIRELRQLEGREAAEEAPTAVLDDDRELASMLASGQLAPAEKPPAAHAPASARRTATGATQSPSSSTRTSAYFRTVANLGIQAAEALEHAHQEGVVHRDIKPANVMVDIKGHLWITDFGLARLQNDSGLTLSGDLVGTIRYMSPEQAIGHRAVVDQRTDIYALGVTLYELVALEPAFDGQDRREVLRRIVEEEPRPLRSLNPAVPRELETIIRKATTKEPESRYITAQDLADDLRRFLEHKPIKARRPTLLESAAKWARRHTAAVIAAFAILIIAVGALAASTFLISRAQRRTAAALETAGERSRQARRAVDTMYTRVAEQWLAQQARMEPMQREFLEAALAFYEAFADDRGADPEVQRLTAEALLRVALIRNKLDKTREAEEAYRRLIGRVRDLLDRSPNDPEYLSLLTQGLQSLGITLRTTGRLEEAEQVFRRGVATAEAALAARPAVGIQHTRNLANSHENLAYLQAGAGRTDDAERGYRRALDIWQQLADRPEAEAKDRNSLANTWNNLGNLYRSAGRPRDAAQAYRQALAKLKPLTAGAGTPVVYREARAYIGHNLGVTIWETEHAPEAVEALRDASAILAAIAAEHPDASEYQEEHAIVLGSLGAILRATGRYEEAEAADRRAITDLEQLVARAPDKPSYRWHLASTLGNLGNLLADRHRESEAEAAHRRSVELYEKLVAEHPQVPD